MFETADRLRHDYWPPQRWL